MAEQHTPVEQVICAFAGPANAWLRRMIRQSLASGIDPRTLSRHVALNASGRAKLQAVYDAWQAQKLHGLDVDEDASFGPGNPADYGDRY